MPAALVMALAQSTLRGLAGSGGGAQVQHLPPAETLRRASDLLYARVGRGAGGRDFVACALAILEHDVLGGAVTLRLANAGQVPPLLCRDGLAVELEPTGDRWPLGTVADPAYEELTLRLRPGDTVVFASDGLPETPATGVGAFFGFDGFAESAARRAAVGPDAEAVAAGIWDDLRNWGGTEWQHDDLTLVVLRAPSR
jgi:serine phosphatase RsbU (regulator of sigma subunit)